MKALYQENGKTSFTKMATTAITLGVIWQMFVGGGTFELESIGLNVTYDPVGVGVPAVFAAVLAALRAKSHPALQPPPEPTP